MDVDRPPYEYLKCCTCDTNFAIEQPLYECAQRSSKIVFYCPYGHGQCIPTKKKTAQLFSIDGGKQKDQQ